jgi:hypothetical protein
MKKFHTVSVVLGITLLVVLIWHTGLGPLWRNLILLGWGLVPIILLEGVADLFHTIGWQYCLSEPHRSLPFSQIFQIRLAGAAINYLTPTAALGGEVTKGTLLSMKHPGPEAATGVIIGKLSYAMAQLLFVGAGSIVILWGIPLPDGLWVAMLSGGALLGSGILGFLLTQKYGKLGAIVRWVAARNLGGKPLATAVLHMNEVDHALRRFYKEHPGDLPLSMFWHIVGMACGIIQTWWFLYLLTDTPSLITGAGIWFLGGWFDLLTFPVPYDIGILEASRGVAFSFLGFNLALGLSFGIATRLKQLFWAGIGMLVYMAILAGEKGKGIPVRTKIAEGP